MGAKAYIRSPIFWSVMKVHTEMCTKNVILNFNETIPSRGVRSSRGVAKSHKRLELCHMSVSIF